MSKELKAPDKVTQKMTRDGAVAENLTTGETSSISERPQEENYSAPAGVAAEKVVQHIGAEIERHAAKGAEKKALDATQPKTHSSRLQFSEAERATPELQKAIKKSDKAADCLDAARAAIPKQTKIKKERVFDEAKGKAKTRLSFEKTDKPPNGKLRHNPLSRPAQELNSTVHGKIYEVEKENVGVESGHRVELAGEKAGGMAARAVKGGIRRHKLKPYRAAAAAEKQAVKANADFLYQKALHDNPALAHSNPISRFWQKQRIKKQYAKTLKAGGKAKKTAEATAKAAKKTAQETKRATFFVVRHWKGCLIVGGIAFIVLLLFGGLSSCSLFGGNSGSGLIASSYLSEDADITGAESAYAAMEAELQDMLDNIESEYPGYDEYRVTADEIEHDPYVLMGYLTSAYQGFTYDEVESVLRQLFQEQYTLSFSEETEIRYRTETSVDPETGEETQEEVPYEWRILNVKLTVTPLENLVVSRMNADQKEICEILLQTKGNRQYVKNVFGTNWLPYVTSYYGYRVHPISGEKNYHTGVDIGMPEGTEILAGHDGTVTLAGNAGGYGLCVAIEGEAYEGHTLTTKYGHCSQILVSAGQEVKAGDVIAKVGNTGNSTGAHLHLEVLVDGQYLNPLYFADTGDTSERHLPEVGSGGTGNYFDYDIPPEALADEQFAAMMAEAEKYLGYPYVWGGASPSTSFDCSGYVSWVINNCGVGWNFGRLTADGLLGVCTPVSSADAKPGDLIFFQGTYNTSGASHVGIYVGNGMMIHCGDPISYANINTSYWQQHFYTFGRLP